MITALWTVAGFVLGLAVMWRWMDQSRSTAVAAAYEQGKDEILRWQWNWQWNVGARPLRESPREGAVS